MKTSNKQQSTRNFQLIKATKRIRWNLRRRYGSMGTFEAMSFMK